MTGSSVELSCPGCSRVLDDRSLESECSACGSLLQLQVDPGTSSDVLRDRFTHRRMRTGVNDMSGVWRFRELVLPTIADADIVSYPEGNTPLLASASVSAFAGVDALQIKHEGMNPTGSFKDRGMTVALSQANRAGARAVACASTGNTSASLAAYAGIAGLPGVVLVPAGKISGGKLAQTLAYGARTIAVRGTFDDCLALLRAASEKLGVYVVNSVNPFRLAGQRTIVYELLDQLRWETPDWIVLPAGNLGNTSAFGGALNAAMRAGLIRRMPRIASIQAAGAAPFAESFRDGFASHPVVDPETVATAIRIGAPASWDRAVEAIRSTRGHVASVTDGEILEAKRVIDRAGIGCEPASAASVAGVRKLVRGGVIAADARVVAVLTGHVLKDPMPDAGSAPTEIEPTLDALDRSLKV